jgi:hypothetical protein
MAAKSCAENSDPQAPPLRSRSRRDPAASAVTPPRSSAMTHPVQPAACPFKIVCRCTERLEQPQTFSNHFLERYADLLEWDEHAGGLVSS